jgi:hypothetical protein
MTTQFLLSLLGLGIAGGGLAFLVGVSLYRWYKKRIPFSLTPTITTYISILVVLGAFSGFKLLTSSYYLAKAGGSAVLHAGQELISDTIRFGSIAVLDGVGKTYEEYENRWEKDSLRDANSLKFHIVSAKRVENKMQIVFNVKNNSSHMINLNKMVEDELILLKDKVGICYPLEMRDSRIINIAGGITIRSEVMLLINEDIKILSLVTPLGSIALER